MRQGKKETVTVMGRKTRRADRDGERRGGKGRVGGGLKPRRRNGGKKNE